MLNLKIQRRPRWGGLKRADSAEETPGAIEGWPVGDAAPTDLMPRLRNLVVATDLSVGGTNAVTVGGALAGRTGARLAVVSVVEPPVCPDLPYPAEPGVGEWVDSLQDKARRKLEVELQQAGLRSALIFVGVGDPASLIAAFAKKFRSNLVLMGAHRLSRFERILAGSTGERIIRHSVCPVMVATRDGDGPFKRILVAVDLSRNSHAVVDAAVTLAQADGSEIRIVYSEEPWKSIWRRLTFRNHRALRRDDRQRFEGLVQESHLPEQTQTVVLHGPAGRAVLREAQKWNADLIVLGVRRIRLLFPTRLGRNSRYVLRHGDRSIVMVPN